MKLTLYTHYALNVLVHLARTPNGLSSIAEIARTYHASRNHLMEIVNDLSKAGFVDAMRGRSGGIRLARSPRDITLGDIVRHTEAGMPLDNDAPVANRGLTPLADVLGQAFASFLATLDGTTLDEVAGLAADSTPPTWNSLAEGAL